MNLQGRIWSYLNKNDLFRVKIQLVGQIGTVPAGLGLTGKMVKNLCHFIVKEISECLLTLASPGSDRT